ncbi:MAG: TraR/DksA family transcriptional regulator [Bryobacteraceae bacterium]
MSPKARNAYIQRLQAKKEELASAIARIEVDGRETKDDTRDLADLANNTYTKELLYQQGNSERALLLLVQSALQRAGEGSFGECVDCAKPVERKRLEAVPWAVRCVDCQELEDQGALE